LCKVSVEQRAQVKNKRKNAPGSVKAPKPKKKLRARGRTGGCAGGGRRRRAVELLRRLRACVAAAAHQGKKAAAGGGGRIARAHACSLARSLLPFVVVVVVPLLRLLYVHTRSEIFYCCVHPGSSTLPSRSTTFVYQTVEPSMSSFKLLWWSPDQCYSRGRTD